MDGSKQWLITNFHSDLAIIIIIIGDSIVAGQCACGNEDVVAIPMT